ncbi:RICIN domain-containing protein [Lentzea sp. NPDC005914]|uniref:RICIN domain-containing protein n=1 Tax=Lentzea sp. NPDC005914 TaxID=3154572 RepID=UPI0033FE0127
MPEPYADNPKPGPHVQGHYKIRNVATGHELAILNASAEDAAGLITWTPAESPNQKFEMRATTGGWEVAPLHVGGKCLDVPRSSLTRGEPVTQFRCTGNANQALRVIRQPNGDYELVFKHSGLRLTAPAKAGAPVTQTPYDGSDVQKWRFADAA